MARQYSPIVHLATMLAGRVALERSLGVEFMATGTTAPTALAAEPTNAPWRKKSGAKEALAHLRQRIAACRLCPLGEQRQQAVAGEGSWQPELLCVGEAPGAEEEAAGRPLVGSAGQFLTAMIEKGLKKPRDAVYITNAIKCRPPGDRAATAAEIAACLPYLQEEIACLRPAVILCLGQVAAQSLLETEADLEQLRGRWHEVAAIPVRVTYHPAYLWRERQRQGGKTAADREAYQDLKAIAARLGWPI